MAENGAGLFEINLLNRFHVLSDDDSGYDIPIDDPNLPVTVDNKSHLHNDSNTDNFDCGSWHGTTSIDDHINSNDEEVRYTILTETTTRANRDLICKHGTFNSCSECKSAYGTFKKKIAKLKGLKVAHINIHSLYPKVEEIRFLLLNTGLDILCISETWLDEVISQGELHVDGYCLLRRDRNRHGGGVTIYVKNGMDYTVRSDLNSDTVECIWIEINVNKGQPILVCCMYRPPSATNEYYGQMLDLCEQAMSQDKDMLIIGDLNYNYKIDESLNNNPLHYMENLFLLSQLVEKHTRVTPSSSTLIDVILSSIPEKHTHCDTVKIALSDHYLIYTCIDVSIQNKGHRTLR